MTYMRIILVMFWAVLIFACGLVKWFPYNLVGRGAGSQAGNHALVDYTYVFMSFKMCSSVILLSFKIE